MQPLSVNLPHTVSGLSSANMLFVIAILSITSFVGSEVISSDGEYLQDELIRLNVEIRQLTKILREECPNSPVVKVNQFGHGKTRRNLQLQLVYRVKKESYNQLMKELIKCQESKLATPNKSTMITHTTTTAQPATAPSPATTHLPTTTTPQPITITFQPPTQPTTQLPPAIHSICKSALNLTDYWRLDHVGSHIKGDRPRYACDDRFFKTQKTPWFRFTGAAGTRLRNKCAKYRSCGTLVGFWSDKQPVDDGKIGVLNRFPVYGSGLGWESRTCTYWGPYDMESINCGNGDVIYKHGAPICNAAYCGMKF